LSDNIKYPATHLGSAEHTKGSLGSASEPELLVDAQVLVRLGELLGRPDLYGLNLETGGYRVSIGE